MEKLYNLRSHRLYFRPTPDCLLPGFATALSMINLLFLGATSQLIAEKAMRDKNAAKTDDRPPEKMQQEALLTHNNMICTAATKKDDKRVSRTRRHLGVIRSCARCQAGLQVVLTPFLD